MLLRLACIFAFMMSLTVCATSDPGLSSGEIAALMRREQKNIPDAKGWAVDMLVALADGELPATRENICAGIAVISQESGFNPNPAVPGLGKLSEKALRAKLDRIPILGNQAIAYLERTPSSEKSFLDSIRAARTERDLDLAYREIVDHAANATDLKFVLQTGLLNRYIEERNEVSTIGSMQVAVAFALKVEKKERWGPMSLADLYEVRDELYTRKGGMTYGLLQLLGYETGYSRKIYRFADYNAGRYSSRNAAFQKALSELTGTDLALDGDLLLYDSAAKPKDKTSRTEQALRNLNLEPAGIRDDLKKEKSSEFITTKTFITVRRLYREKTGKEPPFVVIPEIALESIKIKNPMTTRSFAERVDARYRRCMAR